MSCRIRLRDGGRPKAWLGAAIGLVGGLMSSIRQADAQRAQARRERELEGFKNTSNLAANITNQNSLTANANKAYQNMFRTQFRNGGRLRNVSGMIVQRGGVAQPIGNNTFLLRGMSHDDTDSKGRSGIYLKLNGKEVEAEGGEVLHKDGNEFKIISNRLGSDGESFANKVIDGANPNRVYAEQEATKRRRLRLGGFSSPVREIAAYGFPDEVTLDEVLARAKRPRFNGIQGETFRVADLPDLASAANITTNFGDDYDDFSYNTPRSVLRRGSTVDKDYNPLNADVSSTVAKSDATDETLPVLFDTESGNGLQGRIDLGMSPTVGDYINAGIGVVGSILSNSIMQRSLKNMGRFAPRQPIPYQAGKLVTNYSINPQLAEHERQRYEGFRNVDRTTASSVGNLARKNAINVSTTNAENQLFGQKQNIETQLLNRDTLNSQQVRNMNIRAYNDWVDRRTAYDRGLGQARASSNVAMIQGIGDSLSGLIESGMNRRDRELDRLALISATEQGTPERMLRFGYPFSQRALRGMYLASTNPDSRNLIRSKFNNRSLRWLSRNYPNR